MKNQHDIGVEDGRAGKDPYLPEKDLLDRVGVGFTDDEVDQRKDDYRKGYEVGTNQRLADSESK